MLLTWRIEKGRYGARGQKELEAKKKSKRKSKKKRKERLRKIER